ncbi:MAG: RAD55 family ATPase [Candidatus Nanohaloarchaea archaeon]
MVERVPTGVPGLDAQIAGGLPENSVTLVSGGAGTGKTIFCSQFLWHGLENDENCLFVTLEEEPDEIKADAEEFDWTFGDYEDDQFKILYINPFKDSGGFADRIREEIDEIDADRVAIDSTSTMGMYSNEPGKIRERLYSVVRKLRGEQVTSVITSEVTDGVGSQLSRFGVEEFVADGVVKLTGFSLGDSNFRSLQVVKMRRTPIEEDICSVGITDDGLTVNTDESL